MKFLYALILPQPFSSAQARPCRTRASNGSQSPTSREPLNGRWFALWAIEPKPISARVSWFEGAVAPQSTFAGMMLNAPNAADAFSMSLLVMFIFNFS